MTKLTICFSAFIYLFLNSETESRVDSDGDRADYDGYDNPLLPEVKTSSSDFHPYDVKTCLFIIHTLVAILMIAIFTTSFFCI